LRSKLGFHVDIRTYDGQVEKMIAARPAVIKIISSMGTLHVLHQALGDTTVFIARDWKVTDDFLRFGGADNPKEAAARWLSAMYPSIIQAPYAYWESFNEMSSWDHLAQYADFEAERQVLMDAEGFRCCIGNFATGTPEISEYEGDGRNDIWPRFYPALHAAHDYHNILGLHEYGGLWMDLWYGPNQHDELIAGERVPFPAERAEGWLFGRYRKVWRRHIAPNQWTNIRIVLTEFGLDMAGTYTTDKLAGYTCGAWTTCAPAWRSLDDRNDPETYYAEQLEWCDNQMRRDPYVTGATIFTWGTMSDVWRGFDIEGPVSDNLCTYMVDLFSQQGLYVTSANPAGTTLYANHDGAGSLSAPYGKLFPIRQIEVTGGVEQGVVPVAGGWAYPDDLVWLNSIPGAASHPALAGIHGPADPGSWPWTDEAFYAIERARMRAAKVLAAGNIGEEVIDTLFMSGIETILARLFAKVEAYKSPAQFAAEVLPATSRLYSAGVRHFELHNEPNLRPEGMWAAWQNGREFADWFLEVRDILQQNIPGCLVGWPGTSPGGDVAGLRYDSQRFEQEAEQAILLSDFYCMHTYWGADGSTWEDALDRIFTFCNAHPYRAVWVSEFSNSSSTVSKDTKGAEYARFYRQVEETAPANLVAVFAFVLSASSGFESETWMGSDIPRLVGMR